MFWSSKVTSIISVESVIKELLLKIKFISNLSLFFIKSIANNSKVKSLLFCLIFLQRFKLENEKNRQKINSICKFEFVEDVKSKNIDQNNKDLNLKLLAIDLLKNKDKFEINLIFNNNSCITLSTEIVEVTLEDQNKI